MLSSSLACPYRQALKLVAVANLASTLVGVPVAWFAMLLIEGAGGALLSVLPEHIANSAAFRYASFPLFAAWIGGSSPLEVKGAFVVLMGVFCWVSVLSERWVLARYRPMLDANVLSRSVAMRPNPSFKRSPNSVAPGPRGSEVYHLPHGPGATLLGARLTRTLGSTDTSSQPFQGVPALCGCSSVAAHFRGTETQYVRSSLVARPSGRHLGLRLGAVPRCGLTPRSSGAPTAWRQAREPVLLIIQLAGLAPCRWVPLNSHVRRHRSKPFIARVSMAQGGGRTHQTKQECEIGDDRTKPNRFKARHSSCSHQCIAS
jgi:hypothetical protein